MSATGSHPSGREVASSALRVGVLLVPAVLLLVAGVRVSGQASVWLGLGAGLQIVVAVLILAFWRRWSPSMGSAVLISYLANLGWLWFSVSQQGVDWYLHLAQGVLLLVPLVYLAVYTLTQSGAMLYARAQALGQSFVQRRNWPADLLACRNLPEVKAFRETLQFDVMPALQLLDHPRPEVRICALAALEFRQFWKPGQAEAVLALLRREEVPEVRMTAVNALANVEDWQMLEVLADSLRDPDPRVRQTAAAALLWDTERRWSWMRYGVRRALSEPALRADGAILQEGQKLSPEAVDDLTAWTAEKGVLSLRSAQTLAVHYAQALNERPDETLRTLKRIICDPHASALARIELARLLRENQALEPTTLERLLDPANPAPLRLLAAEMLLAIGFHHGAAAALKDLARLPNRELALSTADAVQRYLGVDLGLALGQALPQPSSAKAIDVTRRLMTWGATPAPSDNALDSATIPTAALRRLSNN